MKKLANIFLLILLVSGFAFSQTGTSAKGGEAALRKVDQQFSIARDLLRIFPDKQAEALVKQAVALRADALSLYSSQRNQLAKAKLQAVSNLLTQAINMLSRVPVQRIQEQVEELVRRAERNVPGHNNKESERLLRDAKSNIKLGNQSLKNRNFLLAMERYRIAKFLLERSLSIVQGTKGNLEDQIRTEQSRFEELAQRAQETVSACQNPRAQKLLRQAKKQYPIIQQAVNRGNIKFALSLYYSTTRLLLRAIDICQGKNISIREQAIEEIELFDDLVSSAEEQVGQSNDQKSQRILKKSLQLHHQAKNALKQGRFEIALKRVELARSLLSRLWNQDQRPPLRMRAERELSRLRSDIERAEEGPDASKPHVRSLLRAAKLSVNDAQRYLNRGRVGMALESVLAGNRFLSTLDSKAPNDNAISKQRIEQEYDRLSKNLEKKRKNLDENDKELYDAAQQMLTRAKEAALKENYELALEYLQQGSELVKKMNKGGDARNAL